MHPTPLSSPYQSGKMIGDAASKGLLIGILDLVRHFWWLLLLAGAIFFIKDILPSLLERRRLAAAGIDDIDQMDGRTFEKYLTGLFDRRGYAVERTPYVGDWGADLVVKKDGVKTVVQAKRYKKKVGVKAVQEVVASKGKYACTEALVVTNSTYTDAAHELARANKVELWDRSRLIKELAAARGEREPAPAVAAAMPASPAGAASTIAPPLPPAAAESVCSVCGAPLSAKVASYCRDNRERFGGKFYCFDHQRAAARR